MKIYRPATVLVGVLFVLLGGLTRLATPDHVYDKQNIEVVHGTIGEPLKYRDSTIEITRMRFAKAYQSDSADSGDMPIETNGVYVALEWDTIRGPRRPTNLNVSLTADGGTVYTPIGGLTASGIDFPAPGFAKTGAVLFEVNPSDLKGLTLNLEPSQLYNVLNTGVQVDLGVPSEDIAQRLVDGAAAQYQMPRQQDRVAS